MSFRNNLQHLRATRNMTQEQLAMLLGVSRQSVTKWESERSYPEMDKLLKLCQIFDCTLDELVQGDLTGREPDPAASPAGPPTDICGYDEHQRTMAWKVPTGIALILVAVGLGFLLEGSAPLASWNGKDGIFVLVVLIGVLASLALVIPAGMAHSAFMKKHPYVEDFYTEDDKERARAAFARGLIGGIACIFIGVACILIFGENPRTEHLALFLLLECTAAGVWLIVRFSMLLGRTNIAEYNKSIADELEMEDIVNAQVDAEIKDALINRKQSSKKLGAICGSIMLVATIVGLGLLFWPVFASPDPSGFEPEGTTAMWFWVAWPIGGVICGIVSLLMNAFGKEA